MTTNDRLRPGRDGSDLWPLRRRQRALLDALADALGPLRLDDLLARCEQQTGRVIAAVEYTRFLLTLGGLCTRGLVCQEVDGYSLPAAPVADVVVDRGEG